MSAAINPNDPSQGVTPSSPTTPASSPGITPITSLPGDSVLPASQAEQELDALLANFPRLSIIESAKIQGTARNDSQQQQYISQQQAAVATKPLFLSNTLAALNVIQAMLDIATANNTFDPIYRAQDLNETMLAAAILVYNSSSPTDQEALDTYNATIIAYNANPNATTLAAYQSAQQVYNLFVNSRQGALDMLQNAIAQYDHEAVRINELIGFYNSDLSRGPLSANYDQLKIDPIPNPILPGYDGLPAAAAFNNPPSAPLTYTPPPFPNSVDGNLIPTPKLALQLFIANNLTPETTQGLGLVIGSTDIYQNQASYNNYLQFFLNYTPNNLIAFPTSFTTPEIQSFIETYGTAATGAGVSLGQIVTGLSNPLVQTILDNVTFRAGAGQLLSTIDYRTVAGLQFLALSYLNTAALAGGAFARINLGDRLAFLSLTSPAVRLTLGIGIANQLVSALNSNTLPDAALKLAKMTNPNLTPFELAQTAQQMTASANLFMAQIGLSQLAIAIGNPFLSAQVFGTLNNAPLLATALQQAQQFNINDVLGNQLFIGNLQFFLASQIIAANWLPPELNANTVVSQAINNVLINKDFANASQLQQQLTQSYIDQGVNPALANLLALQTTAYIVAETQAPYILDTGVNLGLVNQQFLINALVGQNISSTVAAGAVAALLGSELFQSANLSYRQMRDTLATDLINKGVPSDMAFLAATQASLGNLNAAFAFSILPFASLLTDMQSQVVTQVSPTLGPQAAQNYAKEFTTALTSLRDLADAQLGVLKTNDDADFNAQLNEKVRNLLMPTTELFAFTQLLLSPAHNLLLTSQNDIRLGDQGMHRGVDILG